MHLLYPINIARNIARVTTNTHFFLAGDVEMYPSIGLAKDFMKMIWNHPTLSGECSNQCNG